MRAKPGKSNTNPFLFTDPLTPFPSKLALRLPHQVVQVSLEALTLNLQCADRLQEDLVTIDLTSALNREDEVIANATKLHLVLELVVTKTLSRDGILHWVCNDSLLFASGWVVFQCNDATGEAASKLLCVCSKDGLLDVDGRQETV